MLLPAIVSLAFSLLLFFSSLGSESSADPDELVRLPKGNEFWVPGTHHHNAKNKMKNLRIAPYRALPSVPRRSPSAFKYMRSQPRGKRLCAAPEDDIIAAQAASLIDEMVRDVFSDLFVSSSARYLLDESSDGGENVGFGEDGEPNELKLILEKVVSSRLDSMPAAIVPMIDAYLLALTSDEGATTNDDIVKVLVLLKEQILEQVESSMPAEVQELQRLVDAADRETRAVVYRAMTSSSDLLESCSRLLRQLEEEPQLDTRLLLKLVVIRHELQKLDGDSNARNPFIPMGKIPSEDLKTTEKLVAEAHEARRREMLEEYILSEDGRPGRLLDSMTALIEESGTDAAQALFKLREALVETCERVSGLMTSSAPPAAKNARSSNDDDGFRP